MLTNYRYISIEESVCQMIELERNIELLKRGKWDTEKCHIRINVPGNDPDEASKKIYLETFICRVQESTETFPFQ